MSNLDAKALEAMKDKLFGSGYYTVVFKGSPRNIAGNIFDVATPFGEVVVVGYGNAFDAKDEVETLLEEIGDIVERRR